MLLQFVHLRLIMVRPVSSRHNGMIFHYFGCTQITDAFDVWSGKFGNHLSNWHTNIKRIYNRFILVIYFFDKSFIAVCMCIQLLKVLTLVDFHWLSFIQRFWLCQDQINTLKDTIYTAGLNCNKSRLRTQKIHKNWYV